ncbi:kinesin-2 [Dorcoceras hygrometricum]|uniref:Kinesin-2 n=1 Tax=Dorcoceras hygrometricum TaxID=472368 RepID=A0A2Z6ZSU4_9LAMI|nr:kinesin-2 [Dorcoceras hygrometricum]
MTSPELCRSWRPPPRKIAAAAAQRHAKREARSRAHRAASAHRRATSAHATIVRHPWRTAARWPLHHRAILRDSAAREETTLGRSIRNNLHGLLRDTAPSSSRHTSATVRNECAAIARLRAHVGAAACGGGVAVIQPFGFSDLKFKFLDTIWQRCIDQIQKPWL